MAPISVSIADQMPDWTHHAPVSTLAVFPSLYSKLNCIAVMKQSEQGAAKVNSLPSKAVPPRIV